MRSALMLLAFRAVLGGWTCPSAWPCWLMNDATNPMELMRACSSSVSEECWDCQSCHQHQDLSSVSFGHMYDLQAHSQTPCDTPDQSVTWFTSTAPSCEAMVPECGKGYRAATELELPASPLVWDGIEFPTCLPCASRLTVYECPSGHYPKRCPSSTRTQDQCDVCPPSVLASLNTNATVYAYGQGFLYDDCLVLYERRQEASASVSTAYGCLLPDGPLDIKVCALFQTPKWGDGWCRIECASGYAQVSGADPCVVGAVPTCQRCATACDAGFYPPDCSESALNRQAACLPCSATLLPEHADWIPSADCSFSPSPGYLWSGSPPSIQPCPQVSCASQWPLGCHGDQPPSCKACSVASCVAGEYLRTDVFLDDCVCTTCSAATLGQTFYLRNCSVHADAQLAPCARWSDVALLSPPRFIDQDCTLYEDVRTRPCKLPSDARGLRLSSACTNMSDSVYEACPMGLACDGGPVAFECPERMRAVGGVCECAPGLHLDSDGACVPIRCPNGSYPSLTDGDACSPCVANRSMPPLHLDSVAAVTLPGALGLEACACPSGFFREALADLGRIHCWPCGALVCNALTERYVGCTWEEEPVCVCALGPGMVQDASASSAPRLRAPSCMDVRCESGHRPSSALPGVTAGPYHAFAFIPRWDASALVSFGMPTGVVLTRAIALDPAGHLVMALVDAVDRLLLLVATDQVSPAFWAFDVSVADVFQVGHRTGNIRLRSILAHTPGYAWVLLQYAGYCGPDWENPHTDCWALDLIFVDGSASAQNQGYCVSNALTRACVRWASTFLVNFEASMAYTMLEGLTSGADAASLLLISERRTLVQRYRIYGSADAVPSGDPWVWNASECVQGVLAVVDGVRGLLHLLSGEGALWSYDATTQLCSPFVRSDHRFSALTFFEPHLLLAHAVGVGWLEIDLWNRYVATLPLLADGTSLSWQHTHLLFWGGATGLGVVRRLAACSLDHLIYATAPSVCRPMQCVLSEPCGPHSARVDGASVCVCQAGYYWVDHACAPCPSSLFFCTGTDAPRACPPLSRALTPLAVSVEDCVCSPQAYRFDTACLLCPQGFWCPFNGTRTRIACHASGITLTEGSDTPLACLCPPRTHGLACTPCDDSQDCAQQEQSATTLWDVSIEWLGPSWAEQQLRSCLSAPFVLYNVLGLAHEDSGLLLSASDSMPWRWRLVCAQQPPAWAFFENLSLCLVSARSHSTLRLVLESAHERKLPAATSYGSRYEWNGDMDAPAATCVQGYEELELPTLPSSPWRQHCFPCLNGTKRGRRAAERRCTPCAEGSHAPYLGMSACVCLPGYGPSSLDADVCVALPASAAASEWYAFLFGNPMLWISVSVAVALLLFLSLVASVYCVVTY